MKQFTLIFFLIAISSIMKSQSIDYTICPTCELEDIAMFEEINTKYLGVKGENPSVNSTYDFIGDNKLSGVGIWNVGDVFIGKNWYPIRTRKQILKGKIFSFSVHPLGDENDWNTHISPSPGFEEFLRDAKNAHSPNGAWDAYKDENGEFTIEAEVTPRPSELNNKWFNNVDNTTNLIGTEICVYDPFVSEEAHGMRPEIHPSEQIWWKESNNKTMILLVCDASNRFDQLSDYDRIIFSGVPGNFETLPGEPWATDKGQKAELKIPFQIEINKGTVYYSIQALDTPNFYEGFVDPTTDAKHTIIYKGRPVLTVEETAAYNKYIGIEFSDVCFTGGILRGFIVINTAIGNGGGGSEGFAAIQIEKRTLGFNEKKILLTGDITANPDIWTTYNNEYDSNILFGSTIISSDKHGEGIVDGFIDFDGNGITDLFTSVNGKLMTMKDAKGVWIEINTSNVPMNDFRFGDIDGDNKTDVMFVNSSHRLMVSSGGTGAWKNYSNVEGLNSSNARVGDFNGDGKTDIIKRENGLVQGYYPSTYTVTSILIKYGCKDAWKKLESGFHMYSRDWEDKFRFGDFDGNGSTDIFRQYDNKFQVYWSGKGNMEVLCTPLITDINVKSNLLFVNSLTKPGFTDIIYIRQSDKVWKIYYEGKTTVSGKPLKYNDVNKISFGKFAVGQLTKPITMDFKAQELTNPEQIVMSVAAKVKKEPFVVYNYKQGSIESKLIDNKLSLFMDMEAVYYKGNELASRTKSNFEAVNSVKMKTGTTQPTFKKIDEFRDNKEFIGKIENVPLSGTSENEIEIKYTAGRIATKINTPRYGIGVLKGKVEEQVNGIGNFKQWDDILKTRVSGGAIPSINYRSTKPELIKTIQWQVLPFYSGIEDSEVSIMEMPNALQELNSIIYGEDKERIQEIFASKNVFDVEWTFTLTNLNTGEVIPVINPLSFVSAGKFSNNKVMYSFPATKDLLELKVAVTVKDKLGNKSLNSDSFIFYNQRIKLAVTEINSWVETTFPNNKIIRERLKKRSNFKEEFIIISPIELKQLLKK